MSAPVRDFSHVVVGDIVVRMLAGVIPCWLRVTEVTDTLIRGGGPNGWTFDRKTGIEEDPDLGWGVASGITGSFLTEVNPAEDPNAHVIELIGPDVDEQEE